MAKKLLVLTPHTEDGLNVVYDEDKQVIYKETILELGAKPHFESLNNSLPSQLKHEFKVIEVDEKGNYQKPLSASVRASNELLDAANARNAELEARLLALEGRQEPTKEKLSAADTILKIKDMDNPDDIRELIKDDTRKTVQDAANAHLAELEGQ